MQEITKGAEEMHTRGLGFCLLNSQSTNLGLRQIIVLFPKWHNTGSVKLSDRSNCLADEAIISKWAVVHCFKCTAIEVSISYYCATNSAAFIPLYKAEIDADQ